MSVTNNETSGRIHCNEHHIDREVRDAGDQCQIAESYQPGCNCSSLCAAQAGTAPPSNDGGFPGQARRDWVITLEA